MYRWILPYPLFVPDKKIILRHSKDTAKESPTYIHVTYKI
jgi:hypothetical protein